MRDKLWNRLRDCGKNRRETLYWYSFIKLKEFKWYCFSKWYKLTFYNHKRILNIDRYCLICKRPLRILHKYPYNCYQEGKEMRIKFLKKEALKLFTRKQRRKFRKNEKRKKKDPNYKEKWDTFLNDIDALLSGGLE